ncbi:MAG: hypothetical protein JXR77_00415 [Lentisphaeria bacterium]|nr:hypothetical protein [Lentisphaeria bacterium]
MVRKFVLGMVSLAVAGWGIRAGADTVRISAASGEAEAARLGTAFAGVRVGDTFSPGVVFRTGRDGRLTADFDAANGFEVYPESTVELGTGRGNGALGVKLVLKSGRIGSRLPSWPSSKAYSVTSAAGKFTVLGTEFDTAYRLGPAGEFVGGVDVKRGEVAYDSPEVNVPSVPAGGGTSITRIVGVDGVLLELTAIGKDLTVKVAAKHILGVSAGTTIRIAIGVDHKEQFIAVAVLQGKVGVGSSVLEPASGPLYVSGTTVLPNAGAPAYIDAVLTEATAHAQAQLPGLSDAELAQLEQIQQDGSAAINDSATGSGVLTIWNPPFVPDRPMGMPLSYSGNP